MDYQPIYDSLDRMPFSFLQANRLRFSKFEDFAVDADSNESFASCFLDHVAEFTLLIFQEWREEDDFRFLRVGENLIDNLLGCLPVNRLASLRVMEREGRSSTNTGEEVAFPHARTDLVERIVMGVGRSATGLQFGGMKELVHLVFLFGVPKQMVTDYLVCVGAVARVVKDKQKRDNLMQVTTGEEFVDQLRTGALHLE